MSKKHKKIDVTHKFLGSYMFSIKDIKLTEKQREFVRLVKKPECKIVFISGPAGSSKSFISVFCALLGLREGRYSKLKYIRALVESSQSKIGFLPGDVNDKVGPFCLALYDKLEELLSKYDTEKLINDKVIEAIPPNFLRGVTFKDSLVIVDEAQEYCYKDLVTIISRIGEDSTIFFCYDPLQKDIRNSGIEEIRNIFSDEESVNNGIYTFDFTSDDIMRSEILKFIIKKLENKCK